MIRCLMTLAAVGVLMMCGWPLLPGTAAATTPENEVVELCTSCHATQPGAKRKWGPNLFGVFDRPMGTEESYRYGSYLRGQSETGAIWDERALREWLVDSKGVARAAQSRTKMPAQQLSSDQLDGIIRYLRTLR